jgi:hypothetical protein
MALGLQAPWSVADVRFDAKAKEIYFEVRFQSGTVKLLHHAHFDIKCGNRTFAAVCTEVCSADKPDLCRCS